MSEADGRVSGRIGASSPGGGSALNPMLVFVVLWPSFNLMLVSVVFVERGYSDLTLIGITGLKIYGIFTASYLILRLLEGRFPALFTRGFLPQFLVHAAVILSMGSLAGPLLPQTEGVAFRPAILLPVVFTLFQIAVFVATKTIISERERSYATAVTLRQAQINLLRSQSNPHFLFNTLNLLAAEIPEHPKMAQEIVYDLADLLRDSIKAAEEDMITVREELRLATLYLGLQQRRFPDRLKYSMTVTPAAEAVIIPALLLQPVIENVVKHVVAPTMGEVTADITVTLEDNDLHIRVADSGPEFDDRSIREGNGLRIIRETLELHYPHRHAWRFASTPTGAVTQIRLPAVEPAAQSLSTGS